MVVVRKKSTWAASSPKWKSRQSASRRKGPGSKGATGKGGVAGIFAKMLVVVLVLAGLVRFVGLPAVHAVTAHPVFTVRSVVVEGATYLDTEKITTAAGVQPGANIFNVDLVGVAQSLKNAYSSETFTVFRRLPDTVVIEVSERKPVALLNMSTLVGVDSEGVPLPHIGADMVGTLPIVSGISSVTALSDSSTKARLVAGLRMLENISKDSPAVYGRISEVDVSNMADLGISLVDNGLKVIIGEREWSEKIPDLERVINEVTWRRKDAKTLDLRIPRKAIVSEQ